MPLLAAITLTAPLMLAGLAGLGLPVAAHLLRRHASRRIVFPSVRLLSESSTGRARGLRLRRRLLLALRCLAIAALVLAFSQPVWFRGGTPPPRADTGTALVLVIDDSASSRQLVSGVSVFETLRGHGRHLLGQLRPGVDAANVVYASPPRAAFPGLTTDLPAVLAEIEQARPSFARADIAAAITLAGAKLNSHPGPRRIVVLTDTQETTWAPWLTAPVAPPGAALTIASAPDADAGNLALSQPRAVLETDPLPGRPFPVAVMLTNYSTTAARARVTLRVDGEPAGFRDVEVAPGKSAESAFEVKVATPGWHAIDFNIPPDALDADNAASLAVLCAGRATVAVVSNDDPDRPGAGAYFLTRALAPRPDAGIVTTHLHPDHLTPASLRGVRSVFVDLAGRLPPAAVETLAAFTARGGGLAIFYDPKLQPGDIRALSEALRKQGVGPLPVLPTIARHSDDGDAGFRIDAGMGTRPSPPLVDFDDRARDALALVRFTHTWALERTPDSTDWRQVLTYRDDTPALLWRANVAVANFSPSADAGDLRVHGVFVALIQSLAESLQPDRTPPTTPPAAPGNPAILFTTAAPLAYLEATVVDPDGLRRPVRLERRGPHTVAAPIVPERPGIYRLINSEATLGMVGVNLDPHESNLRRADSRALAVAAVEAGAADVQTVGPRTADDLNLHGRPLWSWLLTASAAALAVELLLLIRGKP